MTGGGLLWAALQVVAAPALQPGETLLQVEEQGVSRGVPDTAEVTVDVAGEGASADRALAAAGATAQRLFAAVRRTGIGERDLRTESVSIRPRYRKDADGDDTDQTVGYRAATRLRVRVRDLKRLAPVIDALAGAGAAGLDGPRFSFADDSPLRAEARAAAIKGTAAEADQYAAALGKRVARVVRVSERRVDADGEEIVVTGSRVSGVPIAPGERTVTATVWVDHALVDR